MTENKSSNVFIQSISIGDRIIIENLRFELISGDIQLIKAPNGTGKSVLLSILAGWDEDIVSVKICGNYTIENQTIDFQKQIKKYRNYARKKVGYLSHKLYEESLGVKFGEEIDFIIKKYDIIPDVINISIELLKSNNNRDLLVEKMAKGHRQLMALTDIFSDYNNYDLILLDEPTSYLSDYNFECFIQQLKFISQTSNCSILIASNDIRLFNLKFSHIVLKNKEREQIDVNILFPENLVFLNYKRLSINVKGYPLGYSGQLSFYFNEVIKKDESVILIGPNGSGKSSFLNVCAGLMSMNGMIEHFSDDKKIKKRQLYPNYLSVLFQEPLNYEFRENSDEILTIFEEINDKSFFAKLYQDILIYFSIPKNQNPKTFSSGQLRMIWLTSMLGWSGRWILDEPDSSLDSKSLDLFFKLLDIHLANMGTVIIATHSWALYEKYNFRTIELK